MLIEYQPSEQMNFYIGVGVYDDFLHHFTDNAVIEVHLRFIEIFDNLRGILRGIPQLRQTFIMLILPEQLHSLPSQPADLIAQFLTLRGEIGRFKDSLRLQLRQQMYLHACVGNGFINLEDLVPCAVKSALEIFQRLYSGLDNRAVAVMKNTHHAKHRVAYIFLSDGVAFAIAESAGQSAALPERLVESINPVEALNIVFGQFPTYVYVHNGQVERVANLRGLEERYTVDFLSQK